ncbi:MAG: glucan 1,4-alpha-glucosidase [Bacteroidota bacterium]
MPENKEKYAFGWPGIDARWTSSAKTGVGTALNPASKVWFSISHGILNEIYYPQVDQACTRDMEFIITDGVAFFSEEKRDTDSRINTISRGVPGYQIINTCKQKHYRIEKEIITDPNRDTLIQRIKFIPSKNKRDQLKLYILLAPHIGNRGSGNHGWTGDYKGIEMLFAQREDTTLALSCNIGFKKKSVGFVGSSDGWQDLYQHKKVTWEFEHAKNGNIALCAEIPLGKGIEKEFTLVLGFGRNQNEAGMRTKASMLENYEKTKSQFTREWQRWQRKLYVFENGKTKNRLFSISAAMLKVHESKRHPGGLIASLSIPWGVSKGDDDLGGYHLVWPRDLVQTAGGLLAARAINDAKRVLNYLQVTQEEDGHWCQNMWLDGNPYWHGIQMDQTASPILLIDLIHREAKLSKTELNRFWPMVKKAAIYILKNGPTTEQDRWEENAGYSIYTIAVEIASLLAAADFADMQGEKKLSNYLKETADNWNDNIEKWCYVENTDLAKQNNIEGYYVRINTLTAAESYIDGNERIKISNRLAGDNECLVSEMFSPDALALVRFGLRKANDSKILNTIKILDKYLKYEGKHGPVWYRYNKDGYGEHKDGNPYNGIGEGRPWPLLSGERAHYEIAIGNLESAERIQKSIEQYAGATGLLPEQIWDKPDLPEKELYNSKASGAAMPLAWAHAEYIKLCRSLESGKIFDMPSGTKKRYIDNQTKSLHQIVNIKKPIKTFRLEKTLRLVNDKNFSIEYKVNNENLHRRDSSEITEDIYLLDIHLENLTEQDEIEILPIDKITGVPLCDKIILTNEEKLSSINTEIAELFH